MKRRPAKRHSAVACEFDVRGSTQNVLLFIGRRHAENSAGRAVRVLDLDTWFARHREGVELRESEGMDKTL